jgi:hypothetical protein
VVSQDIGNDPEPMIRVRGSCFAGSSGRGSGWAAGGLVVTAGVEGEHAEELAGGGVDDADVQVADEHEDAGPGVGSADADVVELPGVAEGELAVGVDAVGADPVVLAVWSPGVALGRAAYAVAGVARCGRQRCGRWWL